jgi:hypothetical protein
MDGGLVLALVVGLWALTIAAVLVGLGLRRRRGGASSAEQAMVAPAVSRSAPATEPPEVAAVVSTSRPVAAVHIDDSDAPAEQPRTAATALASTAERDAPALRQVREQLESEIREIREDIREQRLEFERRERRLTER